jgi:hypothetical protein
LSEILNGKYAGVKLAFLIYTVEEELVYRTEDYVYSSAFEYAVEKGIPDMVILA